MLALIIKNTSNINNNLLLFRAKQNLKEEKYENIIDDCTQEIEQNPDTSVGHLARYILYMLYIIK